MAVMSQRGFGLLSVFGDFMAVNRPCRFYHTDCRIFWSYMSGKRMFLTSPCDFALNTPSVMDGSDVWQKLRRFEKIGCGIFDDTIFACCVFG